VLVYGSKKSRNFAVGEVAGVAPIAGWVLLASDGQRRGTSQRLRDGGGLFPSALVESH
jgi:hypothetical protein